MIVNFNLDKITVERKKDAIGEINIKKHVRIKDVEEKDLSTIAEKQKALNFKFEFTITYEPNIANIEFIGNVLYLNDPDKLNNSIQNLFHLEYYLETK